MPDITMCSGGKCPLKEKCYRHKAKPDRMQSYFAKEPFIGKTCEHFIEIQKKQNKDK